MGLGLSARFVAKMGEAYPEIEKSASPPDSTAFLSVAR
ncbi:hypothetical protein HNQ77_002019 [Silvibacterium bohemicum]|uniref:Uncharacterized protein n=1 Tax=Silvibacterium bohemicum TaxID=1577686 RepID=A0A841JUC4_9BACT|nr:hypothetical protein [Silvibacterium bohemicum]